MSIAPFHHPSVSEVLNNPGLIDNYIIITSTDALRANLRALLLEEEEWGVGVPAAQAFAEHQLKGAHISHWNSPPSWRPGTVLVSRCRTIFVSYRDFVSGQHVRNELTMAAPFRVAALGVIKERRQFVMRREGSDAWLPVDHEVFVPVQTAA